MSNIVYNTTVHYLSTHNNQITEKMIVKLFKDDSTLNEWKIRHSIDMSIKVVSLINAFVILLWYVIVVGKDGFGINDNDEFTYGLYFYCLSFFIDIIYFTFVFLLNYCLIKDIDSHNHNSNQHRNVWQPFLLLYQTSKKIILSVASISMVLLILLGL